MQTRYNIFNIKTPKLHCVIQLYIGLYIYNYSSSINLYHIAFTFSLIIISYKFFHIVGHCNGLENDHIWLKPVDQN